MIRGATGLPALAVVAVGLLGFVLAVVAARLRRGPEAARGVRSPRSVAGIVVQGLGIAAVAWNPAPATLDPLGAAALVQAALCAALMAGAIALFVWATRTMGRNWSLVARTRQDHALVTAGPFAHVRHPIYTAMALLLLAFAVGLGHLARLPLAIVLFALGTWLRIGEEERLLAAMFGADHAAYAARVRRFVPGVF